MSREKKLILSTIILGFGTVLPKIATFLILPILTSYLTKIEYGTYDLIITSLSFILPIITLQIEQATFRFLIDTGTANEKAKVITTSTVYVIIVSIIMYCIGSIGLNGFSFWSRQLILIFAVTNLLYKFVLQVNRGLKQLRIYSTMTLTNSLLNVLMIILFVWKLRLGFIGLLISLNISIIFAIVFGLFYGGIQKHLIISSFNKYNLRELLVYSIPLLPNSISWWVVGLSDRWIITSFLGLEYNALYAISNKIPNLFNLVYNNFNLAWQESASVSIKDEDINEYYSSVFDALYNFLVGAILLLITISPVIFSLFIDNSYERAYYQMPILFLGVFFHSLGSFFGGIYVAFKKSNKVGKSAFLGAFINIVVNLIFVQRIGLYAASVSTLVSYFVIVVYRIWDVRKFVTIKYNQVTITISILLIITASTINYINIIKLNIMNFTIALIIALIINKKMIRKILENFKAKRKSDN
jgi:O-antigen/teichoic acid export membrane protein